MLTLRLYWFYCIYKGIKTLEIRKSMPRGFKGIVFACVSKTNWKQDLMKIPENEREFFAQFVGKVGLKFTLNKVDKFYYNENLDYFTDINDKGLPMKTILEKSCLKDIDFVAYMNFRNGYAWHSDNLVVFDKPKELSEFYKVGYKEEWHNLLECEEKYRGVFGGKDFERIDHQYQLTRAPQSWQFIEV